MNEITWTAKATRQFRKLPLEAQRLVWTNACALADWPNVSGVIKLVGRPEYRLRVGRFRILFTVCPGEPVTIIRIEEVKKRDEHTY